MLKTNTELPVEEVAHQYLELERVEEGHAVVKGALAVRPIRHRLEERVGGHLMVCRLALLLVKYVETRVKEAGLKDAEGVPLTGISAVRAFRRVKAAEATFPGTDQVRIVVSDLNPLHEAILKAVGVDLKQFRVGWMRLL